MVASSRRSRFIACAATALAAAMHPLALLAQDPDPLARLDPNTRFTVEVIIDSARVAGVPTRPLLLKALEGSAKHADNRRIIAAVRSQFRAELDVRVALGSTLNESEWTSAVSALQAGGPPEALAKFCGGRTRQPRTRALLLLSGLIQRGVPATPAPPGV